VHHVATGDRRHHAGHLALLDGSGHNGVDSGQSIVV